MVAVNASVYAEGSEADIEDGESLTFKVNVVSGAAPSLSLGQLGELALLDAQGNVPHEGYFEAGGIYTAIKLGNNLYVQSGPVGSVTVTATVAGLTTGLIPATAGWVVTVAGADANAIVTLPAAASVKNGKIIRGWIGATGCEMRTPDASGTLINGVDGDGTQEAAIAATSFWEARFVSTAVGWILTVETELGARQAAIVPDA